MHQSSKGPYLCIYDNHMTFDLLAAIPRQFRFLSIQKRWIRPSTRYIARKKSSKLEPDELQEVHSQVSPITRLLPKGQPLL